MSLPLRNALACLLLAAASWLPSGREELARGQVIEKVACSNDATQTYALYLPSRYSPDKAWPILYAFDAGARGVLPVQRFKDGAERYGYIVAGSNNSRNGPIAVSEAALRALLADTASRFSIDPTRVYLTGFSGGARVAVLAGLGPGSRVAGVIGCAAGFPDGIRPSASIPFAYFGTVGTDDFNYPEMKQLDQTMAKLGVPHWLQVFEGPHDWPPPDVCTRAIEWMEVQGMRSNVRPRDEALLDGIWTARADEAAAEEKSGRAFEAYTRYSALAAQFAGVREVAPADEKARQLAASRDVRRALAEEANSIEEQRSAQARIVRLLKERLTAEDPMSAESAFVSAMAALKTQAGRPASDATRMAARRVLVSTWMQLREATVRDIGAGEFDRALGRLQAMGRINPDDGWVDYARACAYARAGRKGAAIQALERGVGKGFVTVELVNAEPDFDSLRGEEGFRKIVERLKK